MLLEPDTPHLTEMLKLARGGNEIAKKEVYDAVYDYLLQMARIQRRHRRCRDLLKSVELVHEAYIKLDLLQKADWDNRGHFFAVAATAMRQILFNHARQRAAVKRGGNRRQVELVDNLLIDEGEAEELISLHYALDKLGEKKPRMARVVECRFFGGLSIKQTAEALGVATATIKRDYREALRLLYLDMKPKISL